MNRFANRILIMATLFISHNGINGMMAVEPYKIYIENHYGAPIKFKVAQPAENGPETSVAKRERVLVNNVGYKVKKLSIRTTGIGSAYFSHFTDLSKEIQQIHKESDLDVNLYKNAIILIKPSESYQNWDIQIYWEGKASTEEMSPAEEMITQIMNGSFGGDYAQKVMDISHREPMYWMAEAEGYPNLNDLLGAHVKTFIFEKNKNPHALPLLEEKLKSTINDLHKQLGVYKKHYRWA